MSLLLLLLLQTITDKGQDGTRALAILHQRLRQASVDQASAGEGAHDAQALPGEASAEQDSNSGSATLDELLRQGAPCIDGGDVGADAALQASAGARGSKRMRLLAPSEAAAAQAAVADSEITNKGLAAADRTLDGSAATLDSGSQSGQTSVQEHYVSVVASSCERWLRDSGLGSIRVTQHGSMLQLGDGSVRARFRPLGGWHQAAPEPTGREVDSAQRRDAVAASERWTWDVLWGGADDEAEEALALTDALMASAQPPAT